MTKPQEAPDTSMLGARLVFDGAHFGLWAPRAKRVELTLIDSHAIQTNVEMTCEDGQTWQTFVSGVEAGQRYGFRVHGQWDPSMGARFNPAKLLLDPYAKAITGGVDYYGPIQDHTAESHYLPDLRDSSRAVPWSVVVENTPPPRPIAQRRDASECVIYETHVKGFTRLHPAVPEHLRGKYEGLSYPAVIDHLKATGINAIQLLPVHHFVSEPFVIRRGLTNYWGYNSLGFFAPHAFYAAAGTRGEQVAEFKEMVSAFHDAGIEVFLDVVYNHTGEGGHEGPTLSFRGIDHGAYYRLSDDHRNDYDVTGCGNSLDSSNPWVLEMILDSMRYWVQEMGIDGFRFDLATTLIRTSDQHVDQNHEFKRRIESDPVFDGIKMIAEPWDLGPYGYQVGAWGPRWGEWNDHYRNLIRDYWRGAFKGVAEVATRLAGSSDMYGSPGRKVSSSVNFITAHDGFTMRDLVTYDVKHNEANGESNHDGSSDNRSWNMGKEGETEDVSINAARRRQIKNLMATLILSHGVPMLTAGDEIGRTQQGNNNAYCQDAPLSWVHWETTSDWSDVHELTSRMLQLRADNPLLRPTDFVHHDEVQDRDGVGLGRYELAWMNGYNGEMTGEDWSDGNRQLLGMYSSSLEEAFLVWFYPGADPIDVVMPPKVWGLSYTVLAHTALPDEIALTTFQSGETMVLPPRTVVVMKIEVSQEVLQDDEPVDEQDDVSPSEEDAAAVVDTADASPVEDAPTEQAKDPSA